MQGNHLKVFLVTMVTFVLITGTYISAAGFTNRVFNIPQNQQLVYSSSYNRSGNYPYVTARLHSVYPPSGNDNYSKLQLGNEHAGVIHGYIVAEEGHTNDIKLYVRQDMLTVKPVRLVMRGNSAALSCYAVVSFDAK